MNMQSLMAQAQKMQKDVMAKKAELNKKEFSATNGLVEVTLNGNKELLKVTINKENSIEKDDIEMLEDMIVLAHKSVLKAVDNETEKVMGAYSSLNGLM